MFTTHSGKTNHSAPVHWNENGNNSSIDNEAVDGNTPTNMSKIKNDLILKKRGKIAKNKIRPASSISPSKPLLK